MNSIIDFIQKSKNVPTIIFNGTDRYIKVCSALPAMPISIAEQKQVIREFPSTRKLRVFPEKD